MQAFVTKLKPETKADRITIRYESNRSTVSAALYRERSTTVEGLVSSGPAGEIPAPAN